MSDEDVMGASEGQERPADHPAPEPSPIQRQWVSIPGGSCDVRLGHGVIGQGSSILRTSVGRPQRCALLVGDDADEGVVELMRCELTSTGFGVARVDVESGLPARRLDALASLVRELDSHAITSDDLVVAMGGVDVLCLAVAACASWCGGVPLACVAQDLDSMLEVAVTPRALCVGDHAGMFAARPCCHYLLCDLDHMELSLESEPTRYALALMVATAVAESEQAFSRLWDRSMEIAAGDVDALADQALDTLKCRGHIVSSTALAIRQSIAYGSELERALSHLVGEPSSLLLAEGLRFSARISAGSGKFSVDDVFTQDELLERLGLGEVSSAVDEDALVRALKGERFLRSNRFLLALPQKLGRVRLSSVEDGLLSEHVGAWCSLRGGEE